MYAIQLCATLIARFPEALNCLPLGPSRCQKVSREKLRASPPDPHWPVQSSYFPARYHARLRHRTTQFNCPGLPPDSDSDAISPHTERTPFPRRHKQTGMTRETSRRCPIRVHLELTAGDGGKRPQEPLTSQSTSHSCEDHGRRI